MFRAYVSGVFAQKPCSGFASRAGRVVRSPTPYRPSTLGYGSKGLVLQKTLG